MRHARRFSSVLLAVALSPSFLQIDCESGPTGDTRLSSLAFEVAGQNRLIAFDPDVRSYDVWVPDPADAATVVATAVESGSRLSINFLGVDDVLGLGPINAVVTEIPSGDSVVLVIVRAAGGSIGSYELRLVRAAEPPPCNQGFPQSRTITVGCVSVSSVQQSVAPYELRVTTDAIEGGQPFDATLGGTIVIDDSVLDVTANTVPGGTPQLELVVQVATAQVRNGATGPDAALHVDASAIAPGATRFCAFPSDQVCVEDGDCTVAPCGPSVMLFDLPTTTDEATCDSLGPGKAQQHDINGFCISGPATLPLADTVVSYTADPSGGQVLWGWAEQGVPNAVLCPDPSASRCQSNGGEVPDGAYAIPHPAFGEPLVGPIGTRTGVLGSQLIAPTNCIMATQGVDAMGQPDSDAFVPTVDSALIACPIH